MWIGARHATRIIKHWLQTHLNVLNPVHGAIAIRNAIKKGGGGSYV